MYLTQPKHPLYKPAWGACSDTWFVEYSLLLIFCRYCISSQFTSCKKWLISLSVQANSIIAFSPYQTNVIDTVDEDMSNHNIQKRIILPFSKFGLLTSIITPFSFLEAPHAPRPYLPRNSIIAWYTVYTTPSIITWILPVSYCNVWELQGLKGRLLCMAVSQSVFGFCELMLQML